jgi:hypothetical protein
LTIHPKIVAFFAVVMICISSKFTYAANEGIDSFRGVKWGDSVNNLGASAKHESFKNGANIYTRINDKLSLGRAGLNKILYYFWKDKLISISILADQSQFEDLKEVALAKFGRNFSFESSSGKYLWNFYNTTVVLRNKNESYFSELAIYSNKVAKEYKSTTLEEAFIGAREDF